MGTILLPHALSLFFLVVALATSFTATADELHAISHSLPYSPSQAPSHAPAPAPSHHRHHHHHHNHSISPSPAYHPSKPPTSPPVPPTKPPTHPPVKPPSHPPVKPPALPPVKPPSHPPVKPPTKAPAPAPYTNPPRKLVAVQGVVYCKNCSYSGVDTLLGASPLSGATVELRCRNTKYLIKKTSTTDKNGYFFLQAPKYITTYGAHKCRVFLINMPKKSGPCSHATNLNGGLSGAFLFLNKKLAPPPKPLPFSLFTVGPFAFEPSKCYKH